MKKYFLKNCCIMLTIALCVGCFTQQKMYAQNSESLRQNQSQVNVEFTDMNLVKGFENKALVSNASEKEDFNFNSVERVAGVGTFNIATGIGTGSGWTWNAPVLTILDASDVTITGRADGTDNHNRIIIAPGATTHVILSNASIVTGTWVSGDYEHPIYLDNGVTLNLTLEGENIIAAGDYVPGISATSGRTIIINGTGSLSVTGGWSCAGIGGGLWEYGPSGTIIINSGTIYAKGANSSWIGTAGAGIGSGAAYANGNTTINGGSIIAIPGNETAKGIGNGGADAIGTLTMTGNPLIFATSISDMNFENKTGGILVVRNATHWYGSNNFTLENNATVPSANLFTIGEGKSFTIPAGKTFINDGVIVNYSSITINGTLVNNGSILNIHSGTVTGTVSGNAPTPFTPVDNHIDLSNNNPARVGDGWVFANNVYEILDGADVMISGASSGQRRIEVASNAKADITLTDASITGIANYQSPFMVNQSAEVNLTLEGANTITSARSKPGIQVPEGSKLTIDGAGSLTAKGGEYGGAGIGGAFCENCGAITINGGKISATSLSSGSYHDGAGIGGGGAGIVFFSFEGLGGWGGDITINGGLVKANTDPTSGAAGIGGGSKASEGGTLTMEDHGVAFALSLVTYNGTQTDITGVVNGILFDDVIGTLYGTVIIADDLEIPETDTLTIPEGRKLKIPEGRTLTVSGTVVNNGTIINCGTIMGTIENNPPEECEPEPEFYIITFNVFDANTQLPIPDAFITFHGVALEGYEVEVEEGTYEYTVSHPDFHIYSNSQLVNETMTIDVPLEKKVGIAGVEIADVVLYPNPFRNEIYFNNPECIRSVQMIDIMGQTIEDIMFNGKSMVTKNLSSGIYFVIIETHNGERKIHKMVKN
jgi:hypothetical protein